MGVTDFIIMAAIAAIATSDVVLIKNGIHSYSRRLGVWGSRVSFFPYAWGVLGGHFWSPVVAPADLPWWGTLVTLLAIGGAVSGIHYWLRQTGVWGYQWLPVCVYMPMGVPIGAYFWGLGAAG